MIEIFEFRTFASSFPEVEKKVGPVCRFKKYRESSDLYIISKKNDKNNIKIRKNEIKIKRLVKIENAIELWDRTSSFPFPLRTDILRRIIFPALDVDVPEFAKQKYSYEEFMDELIKPQQDIIPVKVLKKRTGYTYKEAHMEIADLLIDGKAIQTVAIESSHIEEVLELIKLLGLERYENINYLLAIKRITAGKDGQTNSHNHSGYN